MKVFKIGEHYYEEQETDFFSSLSVLLKLPQRVILGLVRRIIFLLYGVMILTAACFLVRDCRYSAFRSVLLSDLREGAS